MKVSERASECASKERKEERMIKDYVPGACHGSARCHSRVVESGQPGGLVAAPQVQAGAEGRERAQGRRSLAHSHRQVIDDGAISTHVQRGQGRRSSQEVSDETSRLRGLRTHRLALAPRKLLNHTQVKRDVM